ncbi:glycine-rich cell wall structural protein-like [Syzygium oleosum]|uniref:glycine-rich cell wall structural protein-like n=1 Tax=Syzygium oleosum TaxID=219896 RepID=UPI0024BA5F99|nr:glycine-rich cell wall structural protein-like [Syzygium oleosum]
MGGLDTGRRGQHQGDDEGLDLLLLGVGDRARGGGRGGLGVGGGGSGVGGRRGGPAGAEVVLEVDGGGLADLLVDGGLGDEAEDGEGVAGAVGGVGEGGLGLAARGGGGGEGVEEALGEELERLLIPLHGEAAARARRSSDGPGVSGVRSSPRVLGEIFFE